MMASSSAIKPTDIGLGIMKSLRKHMTPHIIYRPCIIHVKQMEKIDLGKIKIEFVTGNAKNKLKGALVLLKENQ